MLCCLETINSKFSITYNAPWNDIKSDYILSDVELDARKTAVKAAANYDVWSAAYNTWWNGRAADGNIAAAVPPTNAELPNGATRLDVALTVDPATFTHPESWTPLKIGAASQSYLTYNWNNVTSPSLTNADEVSIKSTANTYYPTDPERVSEINEVVTITNGLTDVEKVTAEFWAGGPFTVSPP